jgi:glycosyltransferase involved in cell wall biosynthesis
MIEDENLRAGYSRCSEARDATDLVYRLSSSHLREIFKQRPKSVMQQLQFNIGYVVGGFLNANIRNETDLGLRPKPEYIAFQERNGATILSCNDTRYMERTLWSKRAAIAQLPGIAYNPPFYFDLIVASGENIGIPLLLYAHRKRILTPLFIITHGTFFSKPWFSAAMKVASGLHHVHFLCLSAALQNILVGFGLPADQVHNAGYGVDINFFYGPIGTMACRRVVSAGTAMRDYRTLLKATEGLDTEITIAADSEWFPRPVDVDYPLPDHVEIRSFTNYINVRKLYDSASIVVVPLSAARRACGYAVISEAMAMGKAIVATQTEGHSDFLEDGISGYYVAPGDVAELRTKIRLLLDNPDVARRMGTAGRQKARAEFSLSTYCQRMEQIIYTVVKG